MESYDYEKTPYIDVRNGMKQPSQEKLKWNVYTLTLFVTDERCSVTPTS